MFHGDGDRSLSDSAGFCPRRPSAPFEEKHHCCHEHGHGLPPLGSASTLSLDSLGSVHGG